MIKPETPSFNNATLMMQSHFFQVPFQGETFYAENMSGRNGHVLMLHGGGKDRTIQVKFGPDFSAIIREERSWEATDARAIAAQFTGDLLVIAAENDIIIPAEIPNKLASSATQACQKKRLTIAGAGHTIWEQLMRSRECYESVRSAFEYRLTH